MVRIEGTSVFVVLNCWSFSNKRLSAVLARNDPPILIVASSPKTIPFELSKNRLALPVTANVPSILEILFELISVMRPKMLLTVPAGVKVTVALGSTLNLLKL